MRNSNEVRQLAALLVDPRLDGLPRDPDKVSRPGLAGRIHISHQTSVNLCKEPQRKTTTEIFCSWQLQAGTGTSPPHLFLAGPTLRT